GHAASLVGAVDGLAFGGWTVRQRLRLRLSEQSFLVLSHHAVASGGASADRFRKPFRRGRRPGRAPSRLATASEPARLGDGGACPLAADAWPGGPPQGGPIPGVGARRGAAHPAGGGRRRGES